MISSAFTKEEAITIDEDGDENADIESNRMMISAAAVVVVVVTTITIITIVIVRTTTTTTITATSYLPSPWVMAQARDTLGLDNKWMRTTWCCVSIFSKP